MGETLKYFAYLILYSLVGAVCWGLFINNLRHGSFENRRTGAMINWRKQPIRFWVVTAIFFVYASVSTCAAIYAIATGELPIPKK
jgi:hypothetical protein